MSTEDICPLCAIRFNPFMVERFKRAVVRHHGFRSAVNIICGAAGVRNVDEHTDWLAEGPSHARIFVAVIQLACGGVGIGQATQKKQACEAALCDIASQHMLGTV